MFFTMTLGTVYIVKIIDFVARAPQNPVCYKLLYQLHNYYYGSHDDFGIQWNPSITATIRE